ncbi:MAG: tetratricopeptide repeat protein [Candidatus Sigynarchaeum springense]
MDHNLKPKEPFRVRDDDDELVKLEKLLIQTRFLGDPGMIGEILLNMGQILIARGDVDDAEKKLQMAYVNLMDKRPPRRPLFPGPVDEGTSRDKLLCTTFVLLGQVAIKRGKHAEAESQFKAALDVARKMGNDDLLISLSFDLSDIQVQRRDLDSAIATLSEGAQRAMNSGSDELKAVASLKLGLLHGYRNDIKEARALYERASNLFERLGNWEDAIRANLCLVELYQVNDMRGETRDVLEKVFIQLRKSRDPVTIDMLGNRIAQYDRLPFDLLPWKDFLRKFKVLCEEMGRSDIAEVIDDVMRDNGI